MGWIVCRVPWCLFPSGHGTCNGHLLTTSSKELYLGYTRHGTCLVPGPCVLFLVSSSLFLVAIAMPYHATLCHLQDAQCRAQRPVPACANLVELEPELPALASPAHPRCRVLLLVAKAVRRFRAVRCSQQTSLVPGRRCLCHLPLSHHSTACLGRLWPKVVAVARRFRSGASGPAQWL